MRRASVKMRIPAGRPRGERVTHVVDPPVLNPGRLQRWHPLTAAEEVDIDPAALRCGEHDPVTPRQLLERDSLLLRAAPVADGVGPSSGACGRPDRTGSRQPCAGEGVEARVRSCQQAEDPGVGGVRTGPSTSCEAQRRAPRPVHHGDVVEPRGRHALGRRLREEMGGRGLKNRFPVSSARTPLRRR
jgi:hypothetical protein